MHQPPHPLHVVLLAGTVPLFLGALLTDMSYAATSQVQWKNFASWLIVGGLFFGGFALLWALFELPRIVARRRRKALYPVLLALLWVVGFINAFVHAADAWASIPTAPVLSAIVAVLAIAATSARLHSLRSGAAT